MKKTRPQILAISFISVSIAAISCLQAGFAATASETTSQSYESLKTEGEKAFAQNNYGLAEKSFNSALKALENAKAPVKDLRWAQAYKNLANLYELRGNYQKSEQYLEKELRSKEKALGSENPQVLSSVARLCRFYIEHKNSAKAERLTGLILNYTEKLLKTEPQLDGHFSELEKFFARHSEFAESNKMLAQAKSSAQKIRADDHLELSASLDSIAAAYKDQNKFNFCEKLYNLSLELRQKALAPGHLALAFAYENLGNFYMAQGKTQLAQPYFQQSLEITRQTLDFKRPEVFSRLDSLARTYVSTGKLKEAETLYKQALDLIKENCGAGNRDYLGASLSLSSLYVKLGRYGEAEPLLKSALKISENMNGPHSASLLPVLDAYASTLEKNMRSSEAAKMRQRANAIRGNACTKDTSTLTAADF